MPLVRIFLIVRKFHVRVRRRIESNRIEPNRSGPWQRYENYEGSTGTSHRFLLKFRAENIMAKYSWKSQSSGEP